MELKQPVIDEMKKVFGRDERRIAHALRVLNFAEQILAHEEGDERVVVPAAILHDIGIAAAEAKYGSAEAKYQESEGPPVAQAILDSLGLTSQEETGHICRIIANHHSARGIDTPEFRIIWDADWLVNLPEIYPGPDEAKLTAAISRIFRTQTGRELARQLYLQQRPQ